jgi:lipopolysaccharide biosynthesis regulator YciM
MVFIKFIKCAKSLVLLAKQHKNFSVLAFYCQLAKWLLFLPPVLVRSSCLSSGLVSGPMHSPLPFPKAALHRFYK